MPDIEFDTEKLETFDRVVDVTEQLLPDYDYDKLKENYKGTLLGNYIKEMEKRPQDVVTKKRWNMESMHYWDIRYADKRSDHWSVWKIAEQADLI